MNNNTENNSYLTFTINDKQYAIQVGTIIEVLEQQPITLVPKSPKHIKGIISFRGEIIPIIDTNLIINNIENILDKYVIIVLNIYNKQYNENLTVGTIANNIENVVTIKPLEITQATTYNSQIDPKYTLGVCTANGLFTTILDTDSIFAISNNKIQNKIQDDIQNNKQ